MPFINLIQEQRLAIRRAERKARSFFYAFAAIGVVSGGSYLTLLAETQIQRSKQTHYKEQIATITPLLAEIKANEDSYSELSPRVKTLGDAAGYTARWDRILAHLATQTPPHTWLTAIRGVAADPTKPVTVMFVGVADGQPPIGEFMMRLQNAPDLESVNLKYTQEKLVNQQKGTEFEVDADLAGSAEQVVALKKEGQS